MDHGWQVYGDEEWSFGYCEHGTGVFSCPSGKNPMYTYRECIVLGKTNFSIFKINQILRELSREWPGCSYDLLSKNCNHFCDEFCERLGVPKLPGNLHSTSLFLPLYTHTHTRIYVRICVCRTFIFCLFFFPFFLTGTVIYIALYVRIELPTTSVINVTGPSIV